MTTRTTVRRLGAAALVLLLAGCTSGESEPLTVKVTRTSVTSTVSATGSLQAITEQNLGFPDGGKLVELNVSVGQQVEPGQVLARVDDFAARQDLQKAEAQLAQERAALARIRDGNQVNAAEDDVKRAGEVLEATEEQAEAVDDANASAVEQAKKQLALDKEVLEDTKDRTRAGRRSCTSEDRRAAEEAAEDDDRDSLMSSLSGGSTQDSDCEAAAQKEAEVEAAERQVRSSRAALEQAEKQRRVENAQQDLAVENARRDLAAAKNEAASARGDRPHNIDEQAAVVSQLQVDVETAHRAIEDTVLRAPVAGKIASINGMIGEFLGGGSGTTALAPGGTVPLPDRSSGVSSGDELASGEDRPGGSAFIVLDDVRTFQIVAPFAESDAARIEPNQAVEVTFDAIPDLTRSGRVVSIAPTGTDIQGVTSYYAVIVLNELDDRLMDGQTASANVVVDHRDNALAVPNAAVMQSGQSGIVTVLEADGAQRQVQVELGLAGDSATQVLAGLREGQQIVVAPGEE
ncbi:efflux RND transporter periplasmic adaptor subunit [Pseudonocardia kunmingensis]|uniref:HlyD family secretion protein n=1 Tax=Pseudonocardia kunmingensis TaxID=630975 RepID=A0A543DZH2_9PSEU|nr:HlyD family efflux transporter periplasmic adaptor subunit [Pseudonocardia kunmingensis]TQM14702.1 HlyD family secretion protein [Pseudonocardia kunmingensis]